jgi:hypothetical protein
MIGTTFGTGTPLGYPPQQFNPYGPTWFGAPGTQNPNVPQTLQQAVQVLQFIPQQLQQLHQLYYVQQQQLQQLLQVVPMQLAQLHQLIQFLPHQIQQQQGTSFQQPFGQTAGHGISPFGISTPWGIAPPAIGAQSSHVM